MIIKEKIEQDLKTALKTGDRTTVSVLRMVKSEIHNLEIRKKSPIDDAEIIGVLSGMVKQHKDSITQFREAQRDELVGQEEAELRIIEHYLPEPLSDGELRKLVTSAIAATKPQGAKDFGKVMRELMPLVQGRADGAAVSQLVKESLN